MSAAREIIEAALAARTLADAEKVDEMLAAAVGRRYERPVGDRVNNFGLDDDEWFVRLQADRERDEHAGRAARARRGRAIRRLDARPLPDTTRGGALTCFAGLTEAELGRRVSVEFFEADEPARKSKRLTAVFRDQGCGIEPSYVAAVDLCSRLRAQDEDDSGSRAPSGSAARPRSGTPTQSCSLAAVRRR